MRFPSLVLDVRPNDNMEKVEDIFHDMSMMANHFGMEVHATVNSVKVEVRPQDSLVSIRERYHRAFRSQHVCGN